MLQAGIAALQELHDRRVVARDGKTSGGASRRTTASKRTIRCSRAEVELQSPALSRTRRQSVRQDPYRRNTCSLRSSLVSRLHYAASVPTSRPSHCSRSPARRPSHRHAPSRPPTRRAPTHRPGRPLRRGSSHGTRGCPRRRQALTLAGPTQGEASGNRDQRASAVSHATAADHGRRARRDGFRTGVPRRRAHQTVAGQPGSPVRV